MLPPPSNAEDAAGAQLGGGCRQASPPVMETPTRLRSRIEPTGRDTGVVQQAERRRAQLLDKDSPPPLVAPPPSPADDVVLAPVIAHAGPILFSPTPPVDPVPLAPVVTPPTVQDVPAPSADDMNINIDPVLLADSALLASDINANIDPVLLEQSLALSQVPSREISSKDFTGDVGRADSLPITRIIPPTPFAAGDDSVPLEDDSMILPEGSEPSTPTSGRRTALVNKILSDGYEQLENTLTTIISQTSLTAQQVLDGWYKTHSHVIYSTNRWNSYSRYLAKHKEQECRRLGLPSDTQSTSFI